MDAVPALDIIGHETPVPGKGSFLVQRNAHLVVVKLEGEIVDAVSDGWRACVQRSYDTAGYPPFGYVDVTRARVAQSLGARMRSAAFMRRSAERLRRILLVTADPEVNIVIRTIMRAAGVANVHRIEEAPALAALAVMREGKDPLAAGLL